MEIENHHLHYKEIDGYDEIIKVSKSEHAKINYKKRGNAVPRWIVERAHSRSLNAKKQRIAFWTTLNKNALLCEDLEYNPNNGKIYYSIRFVRNH